jgi:hypothetical protein
VLAVVVIGTAIWRRDPLIRFFVVIGLIAVVLSFGVSSSFWTPWRLFTHLSLLNNVVPVNITVIIDTCAAIVLARVIDHTRTSVRDRQGASVGAVAGMVVALLALVPIVAAFWPNLPMTVRPVVVPRWFTQAAPRLGDHLVVLPYPAALDGIQSSLAWQAMEGMTFSMVGGGGPGVTPSRAGAERPGFEVLARASDPLGPAPSPTASNLRDVRSALAGWGVTNVVVPDQPSMPSYNHGRPLPYAVGFMTAVLGRPPFFQSGAWVWDDVRAAGPPKAISTGAFVKCVSGSGTTDSVLSAATCVMSS